MLIKKLYLDSCNRDILNYGISPAPLAKNIVESLNTAIEITSDENFLKL